MQPKFTQRTSLSFFLKNALLVLFTIALQQSSIGQSISKQVYQKTTPEELKQQKENWIKNPQSRNSLGPAPTSLTSSNISNSLTPVLDAGNIASRAFCYNGAGPFQLNKQSVLNTTLTPIGSTVTFGFPGAAAWVTSVQQMYVIDQSAPFALYVVDTLTGARTFIANCTGVPQANFTGLTWDATTNTMYGVSTSTTASQIFTVNINTGVCTPIGTASAVAPLCIQVNAAPDGSLYSVDIQNDALYKWNKTTGVPTLVGSLGINANFGQDGHFDPSDGQYYWAAFNATSNQPELRIIDVLTGASTLVGTYGGQVATFAIYTPPTNPCAGTPTPGNTQSSANPVCSGTNFVLYSQIAPAAGLTYQWQSGPSATGPWTNLGTGQSQITSQTQATFYQCVVKCGANTATSTPLQVTMNAVTNCYCSAGATSTSFEKISKVEFGTISNSSTSTAGYENFTALSTTLVKGQTAPITVTLSQGFSSDEVRVWIDFNQNGSFTDPGEDVYVSSQGAGPHTGNITIASGALTGTTRMRIRMQDADPFSTPNNSTPCGTSLFGQVEDYTINIQPCVVGAITTQPPSRTIQCSANTTIPVVTSGSALTYKWQYRTSATGTWIYVPNAAPYSNVNTATLTLTNVPSSLNGYQYQAEITGPCTPTFLSSISTLTVTPLIATVSPVSATICTGSIQQITLTNIAAPVNTIEEGFATVPPANWFTQNNSSPIGTTGWFLGNPAVFTGRAGAADSYIGANFNNTTGANTISNWLLSPSIAVKNGDVVKFWSRSAGTYADRLEVRLSTNGASTNVGATNASVGDFTTLLLTINNALTGAGYPTVWTEYTATIAGLPAATTGRIGFRYFVTDGGPSGANSNYIGIDDVTYTAGGIANGVWTAAPTAPNTMFTDALATVPYVAGSLANTIWVNPTVTTNYSVVYSTSTPCVSPATVIPVNVVNPPTNVVAPVNKAVCVGGSTTFTTSATGGPFTYQWQVSTTAVPAFTNITGATAATLTLTGVTQTMNNNQYRAIITAAPCVAPVTTAAATLTVNPLPTITLAAPVTQLVPGRTTTITATTSPAPLTPASFSWTRNGTAVTGATASTLPVDIDKIGTYRATVTDINGCVATSANLVIGTEASDRLWIYPNPTDGVFQVRLYYPTEVATRREVSIWNMSGQMVAKKSYDFVRGMSPYYQMNFDLTKMAPGTYLVKVTEKATDRIVSGLVIIQ